MGDEHGGPPRSPTPPRAASSEIWGESRRGGGSGGVTRRVTAGVGPTPWGDTKTPRGRRRAHDWGVHPPSPCRSRPKNPPPRVRSPTPPKDPHPPPNLNPRGGPRPNPWGIPPPPPLADLGPKPEPPSPDQSLGGGADYGTGDAIDQDADSDVVEDHHHAHQQVTGGEDREVAAPREQQLPQPAATTARPQPRSSVNRRLWFAEMASQMKIGSEGRIQPMEPQARRGPNCSEGLRRCGKQSALISIGVGL